MEKLYDRLIELLHRKPRSALVRKFLLEIPETPTVEKFGTIRSYHFPCHGFRFDSDFSFGDIWWICLYFEPASGWDVFFQDYQIFLGELPSGICLGDKRKSVRTKLGCPPVFSHQEPAPAQVPDLDGEEMEAWSKARASDPMVTDHDEYRFPPFSLHFAFRNSDGQLVSLSISKERDADSFERKITLLREFMRQSDEVIAENHDF